MVFGEYHEQRRVHRVHAFAEDRPLAAPLSAAHAAIVERGAGEERPGILEVIAIHSLGERLAWWQWLAIAGVHVANFALRDRYEPYLVDTVLPPPVTKVDATAQQLGLIAGLAIERNDLTVSHRAAERPQLFDDTHRVVRYAPEREPNGEQHTDGPAGVHPPGIQPLPHGVNLSKRQTL